MIKRLCVYMTQPKSAIRHTEKYALVEKYQRLITQNFVLKL